MLGIKNIIIAAAVSLLLGGIAGWYFKGKIDKVDELNAQITSLNTQIKARDDAAIAYEFTYNADQTQIDELNTRIANANATVSSSQCGTADDANRVRDLWK